MVDEQKAEELRAAIDQHLSASERDDFRDGNEAFEKLARGASCDLWLKAGRAQQLRSKLARHITGNLNRRGKPYISKLVELMEFDGIDTADKKLTAQLTAILWIFEDPSALRELQDHRAKMTPGELALLNSPHTMKAKIIEWRNSDSGFTKAHKNERPPTKTQSLATTLTKVRKENEELKRRIAVQDEETAFEDTQEMFYADAERLFTKYHADGVDKLIIALTETSRRHADDPLDNPIDDDDDEDIESVDDNDDVGVIDDEVDLGEVKDEPTPPKPDRPKRLPSKPKSKQRAARKASAKPVKKAAARKSKSKTIAK